MPPWPQRRTATASRPGEDRFTVNVHSVVTPSHHVTFVSELLCTFTFFVVYVASCVHALNDEELQIEIKI